MAECGQSERAFIINEITVKAENVSNITQNQFLKPVNQYRDWIEQNRQLETLKTVYLLGSYKFVVKSSKMKKV